MGVVTQRPQLAASGLRLRVDVILVYPCCSNTHHLLDYH